MFSAELVEIKKEKMQFSILVRFSDGKETFNRQYAFALDMTELQMKQSIKRDLDALNGATKPTIPAGPLDFGGVSSGITTEQQEQIDWLKDFRRAQSIDKLVAAGVLTGSEAPVLALKKRLSATFKQQYIDLNL